MRKEGRSRKGIQGGGARLPRIRAGEAGVGEKNSAARSGGARDPLAPDCSSSSKQKQDRKEATANNSSPGKACSPPLQPQPSASPPPLTDGHSFPGKDPAKAVEARPSELQKEELAPQEPQWRYQLPRAGPRSREAGSGWKP